jgi:hypothetical protein
MFITDASTPSPVYAALQGSLGSEALSRPAVVKKASFYATFELGNRGGTGNRHATESSATLRRRMRLPGELVDLVDVVDVVLINA